MLAIIKQVKYLFKENLPFKDKSKDKGCAQLSQTLVSNTLISCPVHQDQLPAGRKHGIYLEKGIYLSIKLLRWNNKKK